MHNKGLRGRNNAEPRPGLRPATRLEVLRRAFDATMKDPLFLAAAKASAPVGGPMSGEDVAATMKRLSETPSAAVKRIGSFWRTFRRERNSGQSGRSRKRAAGKASFLLT